MVFSPAVRLSRVRTFTVPFSTYWKKIKNNYQTRTKKKKKKKSAAIFPNLGAAHNKHVVVLRQLCVADFLGQLITVVRVNIHLKTHLVQPVLQLHGVRVVLPGGKQISAILIHLANSKK
jgi:hypothetical protein